MLVPHTSERTNDVDISQLHKAIVSPIIPQARLTVLFDCCHSGSTLELPYVYRPDSNGQVNLIDNVRQGINIASSAYKLLQGGMNPRKIQDAKVLLGGAKSFFASLQNRPDQNVNEHGLGEETFVEPWKHEGKDVWMFSGCADSQTSADTSINGASTGLCIMSKLYERLLTRSGAMSYGFLKTMRENPSQSCIQVCSSEMNFGSLC